MEKCELRMKWILGAVLLFFLVAEVKPQENAVKNLSPSLIECYNEEIYKTWNQQPHTIETLIAIVRKIEEHSAHNMNLLDMRYLSTALLHRFRQDGIVRNPHVKPREGVLPYAPLGKQFYRHAQTLRVIPGNAFSFPNDSLTAIERCTLHSMLSSSIEVFERGDESRTCKFASYAFRRFGRSVNGRVAKEEEVETLTPEQIEMMSGKAGDGADPSSHYPAFPRNHPSSERLVNNPPPLSKCPTENGVVNTPWGTVSGGAIIAGIAAGIESQMIRIDELIKQQGEPRVSGYSSDTMLDNKFLATLAGDLAEVALKQGPQSQSGRYALGAEGSWNSSTWSLFYFLSSNENLEMTGAEIRGDLDGLILASKVPQYYEKIRNLRLSQVLDLYYGERGLFDRNVRACKRRDHFLTVAPTDVLIAQTLSAAILLSPEIAPATFSSEAVERFVKQAVEDLGTHIPTMNRDETCDTKSMAYSSDLISEPAVNLTLIIDTTWPYETISKILQQLLMSRHLQVNQYNSRFTLINGFDGSVILNSSYCHMDLGKINQTVYNNLRRGFDLPKSVDALRQIEWENLNREQKTGRAGGKSDVVVIVPYQTTLSQTDRTYCNESLAKMQAEVPDATILVLAYGLKDGWFDVVVNPETDIISISTGGGSDSYPAVDTLITRIKQVPRRIVNTQCGANFEKIGTSSQPLKDAVPPGGINYYRIHPNYFFSYDSDYPPKIKVQTLSLVGLEVCVSRELLHENATEAQSKATCAPVASGRPHTITLDCDGADYINECKPFYLSVAANSTTTSTTFSCTDSVLCKHPDSVIFTMAFESLSCSSGATVILLSPLIILLAIARFVF